LEINSVLIHPQTCYQLLLASCGQEGDTSMARKSNSEVTSKKVASAASKTLRNPRSSKAAKSAAASALTQRPNRKK